MKHKLLIITILILILGCEKQEYIEGEDCLCPPKAKETNSDFCKQLCYYLGQ